MKYSRKIFGACIVTVLALTLCSFEATATPTTIYSNNFEANANGFSGAGSLQGTQGFSAYGFNSQFLRNDTVGPAVPSILTFSLDGSATATALTMSLAIIDSWDGPNCCGPDLFNIKLDGVTLYSKNFSIFDGVTTGPELATLAYGPQIGFSGTWGDAAYTLTLGLGNLSAGTHTIEFFASGGGWQGGADESWAIDNVAVAGDVTNVPEAESCTLILSGLGLVAAVARRRFRLA